MKRPPAGLLTIFAVLAVTAIVGSALGPLLVAIREDFGLTFAELGLIFSAQSLARLLTNMPAGIIADRVAARVPIAAGGICLGSGTVLMAVAPGFTLLLLGALIGTLGTTLMTTSGITYIISNADTRRRGRATSRALAGAQVGTFIGPLMAGLIAASFGWRAALVPAAFLSFIAAIAVLPLLHRHTPTPSQQQAPSLSLSNLRVPRVVLPIIALSVLISGPLVQTRVVLPLYAGDGLALDPGLVGLAMSAMSAARAALMFVSGNLMDRAGRGSSFYAMTIAALGAALFLLAPIGVGAFVGACALSAFTGLGGVLPSVLIGDRAPKPFVGRSLGWLFTASSLAQLGIAPAVGLLLDVHGFDLVGVAMAVPIVVVGVAGWWIVGDMPWNRQTQATPDKR